MAKIYLLLLTVICSSAAYSQNTFKAIVRDEKTHEPLVGVSVMLKGSQNGAISNEKGSVELQNIPNGQQTIVFNSIGYRAISRAYSFPITKAQAIEITLEVSAEEMDEVRIVSSTRSSRNIKNIPTRIEVISGEELNEKAVMQPANIKMLLTESTGIQTQQSSQVSASAGIRIQGLDGKYTQLLQDGFPLYSGFAGGLSILQIPPLNLKRAELIKGSSSTLYGGGAIAGLVNLITKEPTDKREITFLANINQTKALDLSGFYAERYKRVGFTVYASGNFQKAYDNNKDGFSDIPKFSRYTINPKLFFFPNNKTSFSFGVSAGFENRTGGDMQVIDHKADAVHSFFETNTTDRYSTQARLERTFAGKNILTLKNSVGYFNRKIDRRDFSFEGKQLATFSEASFLIPRERSEWNMGATFVSDNFTQLNAVAKKLDHHNSAFGVFGQNNLKVTEKFILETGLRLDITQRSDVFVLPRISVLYKISERLTSRIGGGLGYKAPTIFTEEAEELIFQNIDPLDLSTVKAERSFGVNADINYKTTLFGRLSFSINQMFFYTQISNPIILTRPAAGNYFFQNANGNIDSKGFETNIKLRLDDISWYIGYTFIDAGRNFNGVSTVNPLTAKHRIYTTLMYDLENKLKLSYELFYTGNQFLSSGEKLRDHWVMGISGEYFFNKYLSAFANFENFLDTRQSRWEKMYSGTMQNPQFREVYTPTDGIIINGGLKVRL